MATGQLRVWSSVRTALPFPKASTPAVDTVAAAVAKDAIATARHRRATTRSRSAARSQSRSRKSAAGGGAARSWSSGIEHLPQRTPRLVQPRRDRASWDTEHRGGGAVVEPDQVDEKDDSPGVRREPRERSRDDERGVLLILAREQLEHPCDLPPPLPPAKLVEAAAVDDPVEPRGFELRVLERLRQRTVCLEECLRQDVVDPMGIAEHAECDAPQTRLVPVEQILEAAARRDRRVRFPLGAESIPADPGELAQRLHRLLGTPRSPKSFSVRLTARGSPRQPG